MPRSGPLPSDPIGKQSSIPITVKVQPPKVRDVGVNPADFIVYPHHLVFTATPAHRPMSERRAGVPITSKQQREGDVCSTFANFRVFGTNPQGVHHNEICTNHTVRFLGVSYDGITDYKAAMKTPDASGRFSIGVTGAQTVFADTSTLANAHVGDVIYWYPEPANFVWSDGHREFHPPKLGYISAVDFTSGSGGGFGGGGLGGGGFSGSSGETSSTNSGVAAAQRVAHCNANPSWYDYWSAVQTKPQLLTQKNFDFLAERLQHVGVGILDMILESSEGSKYVDDISRYFKVNFTGIESITKPFTLIYYLANDIPNVSYQGESEMSDADKQTLNDIATSHVCPNVILKENANQKDVETEIEKLTTLVKEAAKKEDIFKILFGTFCSVLDLTISRESETETLSDFHALAKEIQTAQRMTPSIDRTRSKRIRTGLIMSNRPGCGDTPRSRVIGTLLELGDWSGRKNECTILLDPRLSLL